MRNGARGEGVVGRVKVVEAENDRLQVAHAGGTVCGLLAGQGDVSGDPDGHAATTTASIIRRTVNWTRSILIAGASGGC